MVELVTRNFQEPDITKKVKQYIERYNIYQKNKNYTDMLAEKLRLTTMLEKLQIYWKTLL